jgi:hypothetical protein
VAQIVNYIDYDQEKAEKERQAEADKHFFEVMANPNGFVHTMMHGGDFMSYVEQQNTGANALKKYFN